MTLHLADRVLPAVSVFVVCPPTHPGGVETHAFSLSRSLGGMGLVGEWGVGVPVDSNTPDAIHVELHEQACSRSLNPYRKRPETRLTTMRTYCSACSMACTYLAVYGVGAPWFGCNPSHTINA